jgi:hypothetical protein
MEIKGKLLKSTPRVVYLINRRLADGTWQNVVDENGALVGFATRVMATQYCQNAMRATGLPHRVEECHDPLEPITQH